MRYIGNIVTDSLSLNFEYFNIVKDFSMIDREIPTLIIGWKKALDIFPNLSMMNWHIEDNIYWTYGKRERNYAYELNIIKFKKIALSNLKKNISYCFLNVLLMDKDEKIELLNNLNSDRKKRFFIYNRMIYFCYINDDKVYGISLKDILYEGGNDEKVLEIIRKNSNNIVIDNLKQANIPYDIVNAIKDCVYIIPFIY